MYGDHQGISSRVQECRRVVPGRLGVWGGVVVIHIVARLEVQ
jgi:hypothetical protein